MGQAKRRKQKDSTYGKVPNLETERDQQKHFKKMIVDLHSECDLEIKTLGSFDKVPQKEFKQMITSLDSWIKNRLLDYREQDREMIANSLATHMYKMFKKYDINPLLCICFIDILKSYMSLKLYEKLSNFMEITKNIFEENGSA